VRPHKSEYWLTSKDKLEAPEIYDAAVQALCQTYLNAATLEAHGTHVVSVDEKTGMQAIERIHPSKPVRSGTSERIEFEYVRHGTLCLIATWDVARGGILGRTLGPTRTEEDFALHIAKTIDTDPNAGWVFVCDQLNTHMSEALVRLVVERCSLNADVGIKEKRGVLHTMASRKAFLADADHRIRFVYTPRHSSWLNQIELWFSVLARKLLRRSSFSSVADLHERVGKFIDYFNAVLAKPFRWTFTGRPLQK
jgi:transposase